MCDVYLHTLPTELHPQLNALFYNKELRVITDFLLRFKSECRVRGHKLNLPLSCNIIYPLALGGVKR